MATTLILFWLFVVMQLADIYTTDVILRAGGSELNPILRSGFNAIGFWPTMVIFKAALIWLVAYIAHHAGWQALILPVVIYALVLGNNFRQIGRL